MKFFSASLLCFLLLSTAACKKESTLPREQGSVWTVDGTSFKAADIYTVVPSDYHRLLVAGEKSDTTASHINFYFPELPTRSGTYRVTSNVIKTSAPDEMSVMTTTHRGGKYEFHYSTASNTAVARVLVTKGKISVIMPEVWMKNRDSDDSLKVSALIIQQ